MTNGQFSLIKLFNYENKKFLDPYDLRDEVHVSDSYVIKVSDIKRNVT